MDTLGTLVSNIGAIEEAERMDRMVEDPELRLMESADALRDRLGRWFGGLPRIAQTAFSELRRYRSFQSRRNGGIDKNTVVMRKSVYKHKLRAMVTIAELNPHIFTDSTEVLNHAHELGEDIMIYSFLYEHLGRDTQGGTDLIVPLPEGMEIIFRQMVQHNLMFKDAAIFEMHVKTSHETAVALAENGQPAAIHLNLDWCVKKANEIAEKAPHLRQILNEIINKYYGRDEYMKHRERARKRKARGTDEPDIVEDDAGLRLIH